MEEDLLFLTEVRILHQIEEVFKLKQSIL